MQDDYGEQQNFSKKLDMFLKREAAYIRNKKKIYTLLFGQCTPSHLSGIKSAETFTKNDKDKNPVWIMKTIKKLSVGIDEAENELCTAFYTLKRFYSGYQKPTESNDDWVDRFNENWNTAIDAGGKDCIVPKISQTSKKYAGMKADEIEEAIRAMYLFCNWTVFVLEVR